MNKIEYIALAKQLYDKKDLRLALDTLLEARQYFPKDPTINQGITTISIDLQDFGVAQESLAALILLIPTNLNFLLQLEALSSNFSQLARCKNTYLEKLKVDQNNPALHYNFALFLKRTLNLKMAKKHFELAIEKKLTGPEEAWTNLGATLADMFEQHDSRSAYSTALKINPRYIPAVINLAALEEELGNKDKAITLYQKALSLSPFHATAFFRIAHLGNKKDCLSLESKIDSFITNNKQNLELELIYYGAGRIKHTLKNHSDAIHYYKKANEFSTLRCKHEKSDVKETSDGAEEYEFPAQNFENHCDPIFICGEFRSGTTLVQQILSTNPTFNCLGELPHISHIRKNLTHIKDVRAEYFNFCNQAATIHENKKIVDKMPSNHREYDFIKQHFPKAKFILVTRTPEDIALSLYMNTFSADVLYANDIISAKNTAEETNIALKNMHNKDPENTHLVKYEDLVLSSETTIENLCTFLSIPFSQSMLSFNTSKTMVKTASVNQVREKIYTNSLASHKPYIELFNHD